jgi:uncharacterized OB-fold protein
MTESTTMPAYEKPLPAPDLDTQPFWDYCKQHELRAQRCSACGTFRWPPRGLCPECHSWDYEWVKLPDTGKVYSFVVPHYVSVPAFQPDAPYVIAHITIDGTDERVRITSNVIDIPWEEVKVGMPVHVVWEDVTPEFTLPKFRPA